MSLSFTAVKVKSDCVIIFICCCLDSNISSRHSKCIVRDCYSHCSIIYKSFEVKSWIEFVCQCYRAVINHAVNTIFSTCYACSCCCNTFNTLIFCQSQGIREDCPLCFQSVTSSRKCICVCLVVKCSQA